MAANRKPRIRKFLVTPYQKEALRYLRPPEDINVSEWAAKYRVLESKTSSVSGPWMNDKTPYLVGIMDELRNPETVETIFCKPTQVGGTEVILNCIGFQCRRCQQHRFDAVCRHALAECVDGVNDHCWGWVLLHDVADAI